jgi:hypothetical protein
MGSRYKVLASAVVAGCALLGAGGTAGASDAAGPPSPPSAAPAAASPAAASPATASTVTASTAPAAPVTASTAAAAPAAGASAATPSAAPAGSSPATPSAVPGGSSPVTPAGPTPASPATPAGPTPAGPTPAGPTAAGPAPTSVAVTRPGAPPPPSPAWCRRTYGLACYSPRQLQVAYDLPPLYARGLDGRGRTIVLVDSFGSPTIRHDLQAFDAAFGLPGPPSLRIQQPVGPVPRYDPRNPDMAAAASETTTDVECAHALAPGASLVLAETPVAETLRGGGFAAFMAAENYVVTHGLADVISQSFGIPEQNFPGPAALARLRGAFRNAYRHPVTVLAAANDFGATGPTAAGGQFRTRPVVDWPASDPLVTGVGGTSVRLTATGRRAGPDTGWNESGSPAVARYAGALPWAGSGGKSAIFTRPGYQDGVRQVTGTRRGVPDVALSAAFGGASLTYESFTGGRGRWELAGGTSVATPYLAGVVAIADQYARARLGLINPVLYRLAQAHAPGIVDVTRGDNTVSFVQGGRPVTVRGYAARAGYDLVTGVGTVDAARLILDPHGLAAAASPGSGGPGSGGPESGGSGSGGSGSGGPGSAGPGGSCLPGLGGVRCALQAPG